MNAFEENELWIKEELKDGDRICEAAGVHFNKLIGKN